MPVTLLKFYSPTRVFRDRKKEKRIFEHLTNKNDIITDEDIRNVRTDVDITAEEGSNDDDFVQTGFIPQ